MSEGSDFVKYLIRDGILCLIYVGDVSFEAIADMFARIVVDPAFRPGMPTLIDTRRSTMLLDVGRLEAIRTLMAKAHAGAEGGRRSAVISDDPISEKLVRLGQAVFDLEIQTSPILLRHFPVTAIKDAEAWLKGGSD